MSTHLWLEQLNGLGLPVKRVVADSRQVRPGDVFLACMGEYRDGRDFISKAIDAGAAAVLWDDADGFVWQAEWSLPNRPVSGLRWCAGEIASHVNGSPSEQMTVIGVTGTNGKTSISTWLSHALTHLGKRTAVIGTVGNGFPGALEHTTHTTPDAVTLQDRLLAYRQQGAEAIAMEVSSHGLDQGRVNGVAFDVAVFTNLTRDHLDYHGDMASYGESKAKLFQWPGLRKAVINLDDPFGVKLAALAQENDIAVWGYGLREGELHCRELKVDEAGIRMTVVTPAGEVLIRSGLLGLFNASNLLAALGAMLAIGVAPAEAAQALSEIDAAPGRMQRLGGESTPLVVVDYAHTPDALDKALSTLREILPAHRQLYCVFGCGGDRDPGKRPLMGSVVCRQADVPVVTSDNPRTEDPDVIIEHIRAGMSCDYRVEVDRAMAIRWAVADAKPGDIVLIAGKGHEDYQDVQGVKTPFSDVEQARAALTRYAGDRR
ncbi:UDP-N-acetylmuramoyl-L-alanyl-D-glutamate--2,6-diaminopimelate ligase [Chitinivorax tropicus]|uniref:UDP-N-acetylmuramoyl-L-alanyl-D-glutamate--2,6-diaminopimelate ligase n=1 Tax=Chitinivorax tropicus TaxID=714531 RepID=A0A840MJM9_9PROT|nr:UDP-N-acetylmuramoyl-L-alanyl-D-glutamate--2,6-diaminopimelate ligase [Chitinivorax tropicus]MBB5018848.1 UDP-N-acetylmuramoyl-L-alanyl-D-glutamate--2,6-diaminopimelate ligase [Chitinivorax tropicus]